MRGPPANRPPWIHEETITSLPAPEEQIPMVSSVRGVLLVSSRETFFAMYPDRAAYSAALDRADGEALARCMPSDWVPVQLALAHYAALDALRLSAAEVRLVGEAVARRVHDSPVAPLLKLAATSGATPLSALVLLPKLWGRLFVGGGVEIVRTGPKDATARAYKNPLFRSAYFRHGAGGHIELTARLLSVQAYVRPMPHGAPEGCAYRISWV
jgi:hypothetical protein